MKKSKNRLYLAIVFVALINLMIAITSATPNLLVQPTSSTTTVFTPSAASQITSSSSDKTFYLFTAEHDGLNETKLGIPADTYSPDLLLANKGDNNHTFLQSRYDR